MTPNLVPARGGGRGLAHRDGVLESLQREVDRLFDNFAGGLPGFGLGASASPALSMDVAETDKEIEITAELPGLEQGDVQITMADDVLTIRGEKKSEHEEKDKNYRLVERSYGAFARSVELPPGVDASAIKAVMAKGVLTVTVPKPAAKSATRIEVRSDA